MLTNDVSTQRKKFELRPSNADRLVYYTNSDEKSKRLLALCRDTHQFCMTVHPKLLDTILNNNTPGECTTDYEIVVLKCGK